MNTISFASVVLYISRTALGHKIVGCPVVIDNKKYERNALIFNLCLVFHKDCETEKYEGIVKKLASYFTILEVQIIAVWCWY